MMEEKALAAIRRHGMLKSGGNVIVALSGGADSVALFHLMLAFRAQLGVDLAAAHFEHGLRGEESLRDLAFVRRLCEEAGVTLHVGRGHMVKNEARRPRGLGTEAWARQLRYAFLDGLAQQYDARIATAHTGSDNAETVLFHAIRGAGPAGLAGIPPVRGAYVRPLLEVSRAEILAYCAENKLDYMEDSTNADPRYTRNRLRRQALPLLEDIHPGAARALARQAADMRELDDWLAALAGDLLAGAARTLLGHAPPAGLGLYDVEALQAAPGPVRLKALAVLGGAGATRAGLYRLQRVLDGTLGAVQLPDGTGASRYRRWLVVEDTHALPGPQGYEIPLVAGETRLPGGYCLRAEVVPARDNGVISGKVGKKGYTFVADCDKITKCGVLRSRRTGDMYRQAGRGVTKTLKKWMNEAGIPPAARHLTPVLAEGERVLWVWGAGFCEGVQPGPHSKTLLVLHTGMAD